MSSFTDEENRGSDRTSTLEEEEKSGEQEQIVLMDKRTLWDEGTRLRGDKDPSGDRGNISSYLYKSDI